jgi:hypothetical protein
MKLLSMSCRLRDKYLPCLQSRSKPLEPSIAVFNLLAALVAEKDTRWIPNGSDGHGKDVVAAASSF